jgi:hypothetical protein
MTTKHEDTMTRALQSYSQDRWQDGAGEFVTLAAFG